MQAQSNICTSDLIRYGMSAEAYRRLDCGSGFEDYLGNLAVAESQVESHERQRRIIITTVLGKRRVVSKAFERFVMTRVWL